MVYKAEALVRDNTFLEFRLDYLSHPAQALPKIKRFTEYHPQIVAIGTCRRLVSGGKFRGSLASQMEILSKAASAGCQLLDLELQSASKCKPGQLHRLRAKAALIISFHDFRATKNLEQTLAKMAAFPADFYKIVGTATTLYDNVTLMKFLEKQSDRHSLIGLCMGEQGIISRVLGVRAGSVFTFGAISP
ncbi:MAG TPA: type I 3-dehydroquinate dehydratase, partial [Terriglobales bacterium]|nr:type I 3-dehydroquinate dehydratase [Terriglobales bacterium]